VKRSGYWFNRLRADYSRWQHPRPRQLLSFVCMDKDPRLTKTWCPEYRSTRTRRCERLDEIERGRRWNQLEPFNVPRSVRPASKLSPRMRADLPFEDVLVTLIRRLMDVGLIAPSRCPNGHRLGANQVLVGDVACLCHGGGHTSWHCRTARRWKGLRRCGSRPPRLTVASIELHDNVFGSN
jgi:hypothetical protein